jgi:predicted RNA-binding protein with TRAM domain
MVEIPDSLQSLFTATVEEDDDRYYIEIPKSEIEHDAATPGGTYRIAVLPHGGNATDTDQSTAQPEESYTDTGLPEPPVDEGEIRTVSIESVGDQGDGIAKVERGYVVIVPGATPGDEPTVEIEQVKENVAFARLADESPS